MEEVNLLVFIEVKPGKRNEQIEAYRKLKPTVLAEQGCLRYELLSDDTDENKFILVEKWESQAALDAHDESAHMVAADAHSPTFRAGPAVVKRASAAN
ncbi:putative quinol monooxygenase [Marinobacter sp. SS13-12]|uniref:putative quinol monooxygenase n=1 Tax=Marinobacter sp. SS13-12 TaxID=3050451 RepID=UPI00255370CB|nr:putative quinol monooxygenase [Marinobacter sp. SS13-12]MDK8462528.1 putative quinol monooxygenase [Marinobacter sp. SS13-12]